MSKAKIISRGSIVFREFKKFIMRGNVIDLAVGVIIGGAFSAIVNSVVKDLLMPLLSIFTSKMQFTSWFIAMDGKHYGSVSAATDAGAAVINFGSFVTNVINFLIMAIVIFLMVKGINKLMDLRKKEEAPPAPVTAKTCPYCQTEIPLLATRCPHCTSELG